MIDAREVLDAIKAAVDAAIPEPVALHLGQTAPVHVVIEQPPGSSRTGTLGCPHADLVLRVRVRGVAQHPNVREAGRAASDAAYRAVAALTRRDAIAPPSGATWTIGSVDIAGDGGVDIYGDTANHTIDLDVLTIR